MGSEERGGTLKALHEVETRCMLQQALIRKLANFIRRARESKRLDLQMKAEAKALEEQAQSAELGS